MGKVFKILSTLQSFEANVCIHSALSSQLGDRNGLFCLPVVAFMNNEHCHSYIYIYIYLCNLFHYLSCRPP